MRLCFEIRLVRWKLSLNAVLRWDPNPNVLIGLEEDEDTEKRSCEDTGRRCLSSREQMLSKDLIKKQPQWHLDLGFMACRNVRKYILLYKPPSLWWFIMATLANYLNWSFNIMQLLNKLSISLTILLSHN